MGLLLIKERLFLFDEFVLRKSQPRSQDLSSYCPLRQARRWFGLVTCYFDNCKHQGGVLCNQAVCRVKSFVVLRPPLPARFNSGIRAESSNSIYFTVYVKVRQVRLETIYCVRDVVAVLPIEFMESRSYFNC